MKLLSGMVAATLSSVVALAAANAADIYVPGPAGGGYKDVPSVGIDWSGAYLGAHFGGAWGDVTVTNVDGYYTASAGTKTSLQTSGVFGGGTLGYNLQRGPFVFGIEGDLGGMDLSGNQLLTGTTAGARAGIQPGLYGDVTGRLGYAVGAALIYAKGGFAAYNGEDEFTTVSGSFSRATSTDVFTGWTAGAGVEYKLKPAWSVKAEYQYFDFGNQDFNVFNADNTAYKFKEDLTVNTVKAGINYYVLPAYEPLK